MEAPLVEGGAWMERPSPYHWYIGGQPLLEGADWAGMALLAGLAAGAATAGVVLFRRRDLA